MCQKDKLLIVLFNVIGASSTDMTDNNSNAFMESFIFGKLASNYDPIGDSLGQQWRRNMGLDKQVNLEVDPNLPDGPLEKLWDKGMVGIGAVILFPFYILFHLIIGPFRSKLVWPTLTRISAVLGWVSIYCFSISPSFPRLEQELGEATASLLQLAYTGMLVSGLVTIPLLIILPRFRRGRLSKRYLRKARKAAEKALAEREPDGAVAK